MKKEKLPPDNSGDYYANVNAKLKNITDDLTFLTKIIIDFLPAWLKADISNNQYSISYWGYAAEERTRYLRNKLDIQNITAIDFANTLEKNENKDQDVHYVLEPHAPESDILFTVNALDNFEQPWNVLNQIGSSINCHIIALLPLKRYNDKERSSYTFDYENIPVALSNGFVLSHSINIDTPEKNINDYTSKQILLVYSNPVTLYKGKKTLDQLKIESVNSEKGIINQLQKELAHQFSTIDTLIRTAIDNPNALHEDEIIEELLTLSQERLSQIGNSNTIEENSQIPYVMLVNLITQIHHLKEELADCKEQVAVTKQRYEESKIQYDILSGAYEEVLSSRSWRFITFIRTPVYWGRKLMTDVRREGFRKTFKKIMFRKPLRKTNQPNTFDHINYIENSHNKNLLQEDNNTGQSKFTNNKLLDFPDRPRICIVVKNFNEGGLERVAFDLACGLKKLRYNVFIIATSTGGKIEQEALMEGLLVYVINEDKNELKALVNEWKPDIALINHEYFGLDIFSNSGTTIIEIIHNAYFWQKAKYAYRSLRNRYINHYIAVSEFVREYSIRHLLIAEDKITLIANGLNIAGFIRPTSNLRKSIRQRNSRFTFLLSAAIRHSKCHYTCIMALKEVLKDYPDTKLQFAGGIDDNNLYQDLLQKVKKESLEDHVEFLGLLNRRQLSHVMANAHAGLLPSSYEGFSIVTLEYMFFGLPMILTDIGGARNVIHENDIGIIIPTPVDISSLNNDRIAAESYSPDTESIQHLANAMKEFIRNPELWSNKGELAAIKINDFFAEKVINDYSNIIEETLSRSVCNIK